MDKLVDRLRALDFTPNQIADAETEPALAHAWLDALDNTEGIYSPAGFVAAGIRSRQYPRGYSPAPTGQRVRAAVADVDEANSLPLDENRRRMAVLNKAMAAGGFTDALLRELFEGDAAGYKEATKDRAEEHSHGAKQDTLDIERMGSDNG